MQDSSKNFYKKLFGKIGEDRACKYLEKSGFKILLRNYTTKIGEIDIIAEDNGCIVFVEVKYRSSEKYGTPAEAVDYKKQQKYYLVAEEYIVKNNYTDRECRFDVIEVQKNTINHIKNAFSR